MAGEEDATIYDAIVVGSGPAGGTAAYHLGEAGLKVLVLEKETLPRYKACGGGLSIDFLKSQFPFSFEAVLDSVVKSFSYAFGGRMVSMAVQPGVVGMVMRDRFDAQLLSHARAELRQGVALRSVAELPERVVVETQDGEQIACRYLVGADGASSVVARSLGLRRGKTLVAAVEAEVCPPAQVQRRYADRLLFIFGEVRQGYLWIFPKAEHLSVGIAALRPPRGELKATLRQVMADYGISLDGLTLHGHPIPIYTGREPIATARVLLAGDAAGLADPLSGEGIRYAIKSGRLAAEAILSGQLDRYPQTVFREIGINHLFALLAALLFYRFQRLCLTLGAPNPFISQGILDLLSDRTATANIVLRGALTFPLYLATEGLAWLAGQLGGASRAERVRSIVYGDVDASSS